MTARLFVISALVSKNIPAGKVYGHRATVALVESAEEAVGVAIPKFTVDGYGVLDVAAISVEDLLAGKSKVTPTI